MTNQACRIIVDPEPLPGAVNMAIDAALLQAADEQPAAPVLRIYRWVEPTVSLGYFQKPELPASDGALHDCPRVRRLTGGGAILHHHEITYSCVIPRTHRFREEPLHVYDVVHEAISSTLKACGAATGFRSGLPLPQAEIGETRTAEPFLCFLRSDPRDLAACGESAPHHPKVTGSAQRRRRGTILQHGSILLRSSPVLPQTAGICNLFPAFDETRFAQLLPTRLAAAICSEQIESEYTEYERQLTFNSLNQQTVQPAERQPQLVAVGSRSRG